MTITVTASSWAKKWISDGSVEVDAPQGTSALEAALLCGIPEDEIGMITRNDERIAFDSPAYDGDVLYILPAIIGG